MALQTVKKGLFYENVLCLAQKGITI